MVTVTLWVGNIDGLRNYKYNLWLTSWYGKGSTQIGKGYDDLTNTKSQLYPLNTS